MEVPLSLVAKSISVFAILLGSGLFGHVALAGESEDASTSGLVKFSEHQLVGNLGYVFGVAAADLDGDGDIDLTSPDIRNKSHSTLYWYHNGVDHGLWFAYGVISEFVVFFARFQRPAGAGHPVRLRRQKLASVPALTCFSIQDAGGSICSPVSSQILPSTSWYRTPSSSPTLREHHLTRLRSDAQ